MLGFGDLLERVTIGGVWATPCLWREQAEVEAGLCPDAETCQHPPSRDRGGRRPRESGCDAGPGNRTTTGKDYEDAREASGAGDVQARRSRRRCGMSRWNGPWSPTSSVYCRSGQLSIPAELGMENHGIDGDIWYIAGRDSR